MSSISHLPYGKILDYWHEKLSGKPYRFKFLLTKTIEVFTFKSHSGKDNRMHSYSEFPTPRKNTVPGQPKVSVVIPVYLKSEKDHMNILNLLQSIERQSLQPSRVIIVDDSSPIRFSFPTSISVHRLEQNSGPAKARNIGKKMALEKGADIIAFTDADCILLDDWISNIAQSFLNFKDFQILSGDTAAYDSNWLGTYHNINGTLNGRRLDSTERLLYGTTANLAITSEVAANVDFNENFPIAAGEDIEFCFKANKHGYAVKYIANMKVYHNFGYNEELFKNLKLFRQQFKKYGQGEKILLKEIPNYYAYFDRTHEIRVNTGQYDEV